MNDSRLLEDKILCACGCGQYRNRYDKQGRECKFIRYHESRKRKRINVTTIRGYIGILNRDHPFASQKGYVPEHRLVWEKHNNAILLPWADVHHINGNKSDNRIENLQALNHSIHQIIQRKLGSIKCERCNAETSPYKRSRFRGSKGYFCNKCYMILFHQHNLFNVRDSRSSET